MKKISVAILSALALCGCAAPKPALKPGEADRQLTDADMGPFPFAHEQIVREYLRTRLRDPGSAQLELFTGPNPLVKKSSIFGSGSHGWGVCYELNAKNAFGGYVGFRKVVFVIRDSRIVDVIGMMSDNSIDAALGATACRHLQGLGS